MRLTCFSEQYNLATDPRIRFINRLFGRSKTSCLTRGRTSRGNLRPGRPRRRSLNRRSFHGRRCWRPDVISRRSFAEVFSRWRELSRRWSNRHVSSLKVTDVWLPKRRSHIWTSAHLWRTATADSGECRTRHFWCSVNSVINSNNNNNNNFN